MKNILKNSIMFASALVAIFTISINVAKAAAPTIITNNASAITQTSADLNGAFSDSPTNTWFEYGTTSGQVSSGSGTIAGQVAQSSASGSMAFNLTGLTASTTYYFRAVGFNNNGTDYGSVLSFTTLTSGGGGGGGSVISPTITTDPASSITQTTATLNGTFSDSPTNTWFEYGTTFNQVLSGGGITDQGIVAQSSASGSMSFNLTGLTAGTTYYFRAIGFNSGGTTYGTPVPFTTASSGGGGGSPDIATSSASNIAQTTATLNGNFSGSPTNTFFEYGATSGQVSSGSGAMVGQVAQSSASGSMAFNLTGLTASTTYYFRAVGFNNNGTDYGSVLSFTTSAPSSGGGGGGSGGGSGGGYIPPSVPSTTTSNSNNKLSVATSLTTIITKTSAKVNGLVINANNETEIWFDYGKAVTLSQSTSKRQIVDAASVQLFEILTNLDPNTIYFYRFNAKNQAGQVTTGEIKIFKTLPATDITPSLSPSISIINEVPSNPNNAQNLVSLKIEADLNSVQPGDDINYKISYKNIGEKNIKDVILQVALPARVEFINSSKGNFGVEDNTVTVDLGEISALAEGSIDLKVKVASDVKDKEILIASASLVYTDGENGAQKDLIDYALTDVNNTGNSLAAASIFGNGTFLPNTLVGWLFLLLIIIGVVMLGKKLYVEVNWQNLTNKFKK